MARSGSVHLPLAVGPPGSVSSAPSTSVTLRHSALVRFTHWIITLCFFALLVSGIEIVISHPRFYWGENGNDLTPTLFKLPIPSSRALVPTGYGYVLPDQNGWSRNLHFQAAWIAVWTGLLYMVFGFLTGHFRKNLFPAKADLSWHGHSAAIATHLRFAETVDSAVIGRDQSILLRKARRDAQPSYARSGRESCYDQLAS